jgi:hypothetical protein
LNDHCGDDVLFGRITSRRCAIEVGGKLGQYHPSSLARSCISMLKAIKRTFAGFFPAIAEPNRHELVSLSHEELEASFEEARLQLFGLQNSDPAWRDKYIDLQSERDRRREERLRAISHLSDEQIATHLSEKTSLQGEPLESDDLWLDAYQLELSRRKTADDEERRADERRARVKLLAEKSDAQLQGDIAVTETMLSDEHSESRPKLLSRFRELVEERERRVQRSKSGERWRDRLRTYAAVFAAGAAIGGLLFTLITKFIP